MSDFPASLQEALARAEGDPRISNTQSQAMQAANRPRHRPMPRVMRQQPGPSWEQRHYGAQQGDISRRHEQDIQDAREAWTYGNAGQRIAAMPRLALEATGLMSVPAAVDAVRNRDWQSAAPEALNAGLTLAPEIAGIARMRPGVRQPPMRAREPMGPPDMRPDTEGRNIARAWIDSFGGGPEAEARAIVVMTERLRETGHPILRQRLQDGIDSVRTRDYVRGARGPFSARVEEAWPDIYGGGATEPPPAPIRTPAREIGANGLPVSQRQPFRTSLRGGADDLNEAAAMRAPDEAPPAAGSGAGPQQSSLGPQRTYTFAGPRGQTYEVQVAPDERAGQAVVGFWRQRADGFAPRLRPHNDLSPGEARGVYREVARLLREDAAQYGRPSYHARGYTGRQSALYRALAEQEGGLPGYQVAAGENGALVFRRAQNKPPSSEPLASSIGGIPIPQVVRRDFQRLGENIGRFKDEVVEGAGTARLASPQQYRGFGGRAVAMGDIAKLPFDPPRAPLFGAYRHAGRLSAEPPSKVMATWALGVAPVGAGTAALLPPIRRAGEERQAENRAVYAMERMNAEDKARLNSITQARPMPYQNPGRPAWEDRRIYTMPGDLEEPNEGYAINPATGRPLPAPKFRRNKNAPAFTGAFR